jgi:hypothetical protein
MRARELTYHSSKRTKEGVKLDVLMKAVLSFAKEQKSRESRASRVRLQLQTCTVPNKG